MESIKLTKKQKNKLLEMCKAFFPELQKKAYNKSLLFYKDKDYACGFYITGNNNIGCSYPICEDDDSFHHHLFEHISWFEFCMTHLFKKIFGDKDLNKYSKGPIDTTDYECNIIDMFENHPVDYLYDEFKKLQL